MANSTYTYVHSERIFNIDNQAFCSYLICASLLILKMMGTTLLVVFHRMRTKSFISEEDVVWQGGQVGTNDTIERVRRSIMNDLENIPIFLIMSLGYLWSQSPLWAVNLLFLTYLITRTLHTFVYAIYVMRQPIRAVLWTVGYAIIAYMAVHTAIYAFIKGYVD